MSSRVNTALGGKRDRGFTLIELLVVTAIVGLLSAIGAGQILKARQKAVAVRVQADLNALATAFEKIYSDTQVYPLQEKDPLDCYNQIGTPCTGSTGGNEAYVDDPNMGFVENPTTPGCSFEGWRGPYISNYVVDPATGRMKIRDPWGKSYIYDSDYCYKGHQARVIHSGGPDKSGINDYGNDNIVKIICISDVSC